MKSFLSIQELTARGKAALIGAVVGGLAVLVLTAGPLFAQTPPPPAGPPSGTPPTHEQMHQMMDAMHGEGTSERMHAAMGPEAEQLMDQCLAMMAMMQNMQGMMGGSMSGMMEDQDGQSMQEMMNGMMGR